ncbi:DUF2332 family protein [Sphingomonas sp. BK580]|uniref:DUF2332 domain-containing protein n=1 Tax=Sphingomonas sp. BK580 TaxID=2586972 RepID=UPI00183FCA0E|nr:DUF2332 family protein [Sphingomonas sp. BK580]MBB3692320.1 hypothetical protein [Sphingomonas sp. BK580]
MSKQLLDDERDAGELRRQAALARAIGSPFVAAVLESGAHQLARAPLTATVFARWPGDRAAAALAMRFNAALHALARRNTPARLGALYRGEHRDIDGAVGEALALHDGFIADWMQHTPQTNEVGRAAAILAALKVARTRFDLPVELLELGASAGLNLNLCRYAYEIGGVAAGDPASPVRIAPDWIGAPPPGTPVEVVAARGVDLAPLDVTDAATRERLMAFVFADQSARSRRLESALALARAWPPRVERGDAVTWLRDRLAEPAPAGRCRAVVHSMVTQYLDDAARARLDAVIAAAGAAATEDRPLVRIGFEWTEDRAAVLLRLTSYPHGGMEVLAECHPYGATITWRAPAAPSLTK